MYSAPTSRSIDQSHNRKSSIMDREDLRATAQMACQESVRYARSTKGMTEEEKSDSGRIAGECGRKEDCDLITSTS